MDKIRASLKLAAFFLVAALTVFCTGLARLLPEAGYLRLKTIFAKYFAKSSVFITGMTIKVTGTPPEPPFFLVSNHVSYMDILPYWYCCKGTFIAKNEIKSWPFFGFATKIMGVLFIDRDNKRDISRVNRLISTTISNMQGVILFPEGTSTNGKEVLPFKASLLQYPAMTSIPVSYASIAYQSSDPSKPAGDYICWWGEMTFFDHFFELLKLRSFTVEIHFGDREISNNDRKRLASALHKKVSENMLQFG